MKKILLAVLLMFCVFPGGVDAADARYVLNSASLTPTVTGLAPCDKVVADTLASITNNQMSTYDKVKACYDYLISTCSYERHSVTYHYEGGYLYVVGLRIPERDVNKYSPGAIDAYYMLTGHKGVCDDYACAFAALVRAIGVNCYTVSGQTAKANGGMTGHTWNIINIGGQDYVFDAQIDDNIAKGGAIGYYRFCVTYDEVPWAYAYSKINDNFKPF